MKRIFLLIVPALIILIAFMPKASHTIIGSITSAEGIALSSVNVSLKGAKVTVQSLADGSYSITVNNPNGILVFSAPGYQTQEEKIKGRTVINVQLKSLLNTQLQPIADSTQFFELKNSGSSAYIMPRGKVAWLSANGNNSYSFSPYTVNTPATIVEDEKIGYKQNDNIADFNTEDYDKIIENRFLRVTDNPLSTFSIDVDAASYSNIRRYLTNGQMPPAGAVRIEEMINYFHYTYPQPEKDQPFSINTEISDAPWNKDHKLVLIGLQGKKIPAENLPPSNLVFLIDVSGSMSSPNKLPLVKASMKMLVDQLREEDKVAMVVYAGAAGLVLPPTSGSEKIKIKNAIDNLESGGSTAGGAGIKLAYKTAKEYFVKEGNNRVILCTDGDFNIGESSDDAMERLIENERKSGVFLTVLGYGMGNYKDNKMQKLADKGNGNHAYIDGMSEAKKVLVNEFGGTLFTIAKDVKLQVEFNPAKVQGYRLIGYENRMLAKEDFNDDKKDAGELGSGHTVTALYEVIPVGIKDSFLTKVDDLKYQKNKIDLSKESKTEEILTVKFRYKAPDGDVSKLIEHPVLDQHISIARTSDNFRFAAAVAEFGMLLRNSEYKSQASFLNVINMARQAKGNDEEGYRAEFIRMAENAGLLAKGNNTEEINNGLGIR